jgi:hypothetical protein
MGMPRLKTETSLSVSPHTLKQYSSILYVSVLYTLRNSLSVSHISAVIFGWAVTNTCLRVKKILWIHFILWCDRP